MIQMIGKYCITLEDNSGDNYRVENTDNLEQAVNFAAQWFAESQCYSGHAQHAVCVNIFKRINAGSGCYDYDAIATFRRHPRED